MRIIDSHFHWWPRPIFERLCNRKGFPRAVLNGRGGYAYLRKTGEKTPLSTWAEWFDLDKQFEYMASLGHQVDVVCSIGPFSVSFSDMPLDEGRDYAIMWNEEMAGAQKKYPGRVWASAAVPLVDTKVAIEVLDHAINKLGLMGANLPGSVGSDARIDHERLEPFYARAAELGGTDSSHCGRHERSSSRAASPNGFRRGGRDGPLDIIATTIGWCTGQWRQGGGARTVDTC